MSTYPMFGSTQLDPRISGEAAPSEVGIVDELSRGYRRGLRGAGSSLAELAGAGAEALGATEVASGARRVAGSLREAAGAPELAPSVRSVRDVDSVGSGLRWGAGMMGEMTPVLAAAVAGGALTKNPMVGGTIAMAPFEAGDIASRQDKTQGTAGSRLAEAAGGGLASAVVGNVLPTHIMGKFGKGLRGESSFLPAMGKNIAEGAAVGGVSEAGSEGVKQFAAGQDLDQEAITEAGLGGAAFGGAFGVPAGVASYAKGNAESIGKTATALKDKGMELGGKIKDKGIELGGKIKDRAEDEGIDLGAAFDKGTDLVKRGRTKVDESVDRVINGQPLGDTLKEFATATGDRAKEIMDLSAEEKGKKVREWATKMADDAGFNEEKRASVVEAAQKVGDRAADITIATAKKAYDAAMRAKEQIIDFSNSFDPDNRGGSKKSEDYSGPQKAILEALRESGLVDRRPDLFDHNDNINALASTLRKTMVQLAKGPLTDRQVKGLTRVLGDDTMPVLSALRRAVLTDADTESFFKNVGAISDAQRRSDEFHKQIKTLMTPEALEKYEKASFNLGELEDMLVADARRKGGDSTFGTIALNNTTKEAYRTFFGPKADAAMTLVEKYAKQGQNKDPAQLDMLPESKKLLKRPEKSGREDAAPVDRIDEAGNLVEASDGGFDEDGRRVEAEQTKRLEFGLGPVRRDGGQRSVLNGDPYEDGSPRLTQHLSDIKGRYPDYAVKFDKESGRIVAEKSVADGTLTDDAEAAMRLDTKKYANSPSRLKIGDNIYDAMRVTSLTRKNMRKQDGERADIQMARAFHEGVAALIERHGAANVDIPDSTLIGSINGVKMTAGQAKALKPWLSKEDRIASKLDADIVDLRVRYKEAKRSGEDVSEILELYKEKVAEREALKLEIQSRENARPESGDDDSVDTGKRPAGKYDNIHLAARDNKGEALVNRSNMQGQAHSAPSPTKTGDELVRKNTLSDAIDKWAEQVTTEPGRRLVARARVLYDNIDVMSANDRQRFYDTGISKPETSDGPARPSRARDALEVVNALARKYAKQIEGRTKWGPKNDVRSSLNPTVAPAKPTKGKATAAEIPSERNTFTVLDNPKYREPSKQTEMFPLQNNKNGAPKTLSTEKELLRKLEYLNNPPPDYTTAMARQIVETSKKELAVSTDDSLRTLLRQIIKKGESVLEGDAALDKMEGAPDPKVVAAKKAALLERAASGDEALIRELRTTDDAKGLQRALETLNAEPEAKTGATLPGAGPYTLKDQAKANQATKFIGRGSKASSTNAYAQAFGDRANSGKYTAADTVFISAEGARGGRLDPDFAEIKKAVDAGVTFVTDDAQNRARTYNLGERQVAKFLKENGYTDEGSGTWKSKGIQEAREAATARMSELVKDDNVAYQLQTRKYSLVGVGIHNDLNKPGFPATHDSPIKHEGKFDWRKHKGKGEGNAAFGAGTYLSTADGVHKSYKNKFTADARAERIRASGLRGYDSQLFDEDLLQEAAQRLEAMDGQQWVITKDVNGYPHYQLGKDKDGFFTITKELNGPLFGEGNYSLRYYTARAKKRTLLNYGKTPEWLTANMPSAKQLAEAAKVAEKSPTYEVSVNIEPHQILDWDKPLSEQPKEMRDALGALAAELPKPTNKPFKQTGPTTFMFDGKQFELKTNPSGRAYIYPVEAWAAHIGSVDGAGAQAIANAEAYLQAGGRETAKLKNVFNSLVDTDARGADWYRELTKKFGSQEAASDYLQSLGILGHRYNASGGKNDAHPNFVIYDDSKIETNYVHFSRTPVDKNATGPINKKAVEDHINTVLGGSIRTFWPQLSVMDWAGDYTHVQKLLRISVQSLNPMSVAYHESMHAFVANMRDMGAVDVVNALEKAANSPHNIVQVREFFKNEPEVLKQLSDPEERVAYMYQLWASGHLKPAPGARNIFEKIAAFFRKILGVWSNDQRAEHIMEYFNSGEYGRNMSTPNAVRRALMEPGRNKAYDAAQGLGTNLMKLSETLFATGSARVRETGVPALRDIADAVKRQDSDTRGGTRGFVHAARIAATKMRTQFAHRIGNVTQEQLSDALNALQKNTRATTPEARLVVRAVHKQLQEARQYMLDAGADVGDLGKDYFPRVWDIHYISKNQQAFRDMLAPYVRSGEFGGDVDKLIQKLIASEGHEFSIETDMPGFQFGKQRVLAFIKDADAAEFLNKDLLETMHSYITQAARRAEWFRIFGNGKLDALLVRARKEGATQEQIDATNQYLRGVNGTLGDDISPALRRIYGNTIVYQNVRLLPLAVFSSLVDPMGIIVRGGTVREAWQTFVQGMRDIPGSFRKKRQKPGQMEEIAELVGVIDSAMLNHITSDMYTQGMVGGTAKKINNTLFKYNLMESLNRSFRVGATEAAMKFIAKHADGKASRHSERWIKELGLNPADIVKYKDRIALTKAEGLTEEAEVRIHAAINQWVDGAILRPDAADKPIWMNDPHYAIFAHLKQFVYAFQKTILARVWHEAKHGNYSPTMAMASYVPVMVASDFIKGMIQGGGEQPEWKAGWGPAEYIGYGVQRAGLLGVGQFGIDAYENARRGGLGVTALGGPTVEQLVDVLGTLSGRKQFGAVALDALPANALYSEAVGPGR